MGVSRDSRHKRRLTGGRMKIHQKKRKFELARPAANTRLGASCIRTVRCRGGNIKYRALRLESGNFAWGSEATTHKSKIVDVVYNASNNELVRTKTLVKNAIVQIDATPFKTWYEKFYGISMSEECSKLKKAQAEGQSIEEIAKEAAAASSAQKAAVSAEAKKESAEKEKASAEQSGSSSSSSSSSASSSSSSSVSSSTKLSKKTKKLVAQHQKIRVLDPHLIEQFAQGRLFACLASRPGQSGRADGYILEGPELLFYIKKMQKKKAK